MLELIRPYLTFPYVVLSLIVLRVLYNQGLKLYLDRRISQYGRHAPIRHTYLPYGIDMIYEVVKYMLADKNYELWLKMFKTYGNGTYTVEAGLGERRVILTAEPDNIKAILATQFKDFGKGEKFRKEWHPFLGNGIFTTDGELWHNSRQLLRPQFIKDRVSDLGIFEEHVQILMNKLGQDGDIDMLDYLFRYTLDASTHFLLGKSVESQINGQTEFADAFYQAQRIQSIIARTGPMNWLVPRTYMGYYTAIKKVNEFVDQYIDQALSLSQAELEKKTNHDEGYTFLHAIASYTRDRTVLRDQLVSVLLAGRDTTACMLTWTIYELSKSPKIMAKLRQEIIDQVGLERAPTYQDLKEMKYLSHVLNETLRIYPAVPFNVRFALKDTTLPTGGGPDGSQPIGVLKGTSVGYSTLVMQRREDLFPPPSSNFPDVKTFAPERWDGWTPKSWTYVPFNGGPRICIGQQFALTEMGYTLVRLFQRFRSVENRMGGVSAGLHCDIVLQPAREVRVVFR